MFTQETNPYATLDIFKGSTKSTYWWLRYPPRKTLEDPKWLRKGAYRVLDRKTNATRIVKTAEVSYDMSYPHHGIIFNEVEALERLKGIKGFPKLVERGFYQRYGKEVVWLAETDLPGKPIGFEKLRTFPVEERLKIIRSYLDRMDEAWKAGVVFQFHRDNDINWDEKTQTASINDLRFSDVLSSEKPRLFPDHKKIFQPLIEKIARVVPFSSDQVDHLKRGYDSIIKYGAKLGDEYGNIGYERRRELRKMSKDQHNTLFIQTIAELSLGLGKPDISVKELEKIQADPAQSEERKTVALILLNLKDPENRRQYDGNREIRLNLFRNLTHLGLHQNREEIMARLNKNTPQKVLPILSDTIKTIKEYQRQIWNRGISVPSQLNQFLIEINTWMTQSQATPNAQSAVARFSQIMDEVDKIAQTYNQKQRQEAHQETHKQKVNDFYSFALGILGPAFGMKESIGQFTGFSSTEKYDKYQNDFEVALRNNKSLYRWASEHLKGVKWPGDNKDPQVLLTSLKAAIDVELRQLELAKKATPLKIPMLTITKDEAKTIVAPPKREGYITQEIPRDKMKLVGKDGDKLKIVMSESALKKANIDLLRRSWMSGHFLEQGGGFVGRVYKTNKGQLWVDVVDYLPARHTEFTGGSVTFTTDTFGSFDTDLQRLRKEKKDPGLILVGWAHTHPETWEGRMSGYDDFINKHFFDEEYHFAYVFAAGLGKNIPTDLGRDLSDLFSFFSKGGKGQSFGTYLKHLGIYLKQR